MIQIWKQTGKLKNSVFFSELCLVSGTLDDEADPEPETACPAYDVLNEPTSSSERDRRTEQETRERQNRLLRIHRNLGHPSKKLMLAVLKEAKAPEQTLKAVQQMRCEVCERFQRTSPAKPANIGRAREVGQVLAMDFHIRQLRMDFN